MTLLLRRVLNRTNITDLSVLTGFCSATMKSLVGIRTIFALTVTEMVGIIRIRYGIQIPCGTIVIMLYDIAVLLGTDLADPLFPADELAARVGVLISLFRTALVQTQAEMLCAVIRPRGVPIMSQRVSVREGVISYRVMSARAGIVVGCRLGTGCLGRLILHRGVLLIVDVLPLSITGVAGQPRVRICAGTLVVVGSLLGIRCPGISPSVIQRVSVFEGIVSSLIMAAYARIVVGCRLGTGCQRLPILLRGVLLIVDVLPLSITGVAGQPRVRICAGTLVVVGSLLGIQRPAVCPSVAQLISILEGVVRSRVISAHAGIVVGCRLGTGCQRLPILLRGVLLIVDVLRLSITGGAGQPRVRICTGTLMVVGSLLGIQRPTVCPFVTQGFTDRKGTVCGRMVSASAGIVVGCRLIAARLILSVTNRCYFLIECVLDPFGFK